MTTDEKLTPLIRKLNNLSQRQRGYQTQAKLDRQIISNNSDDIAAIVEGLNALQSGVIDLHKQMKCHLFFILALSFLILVIAVGI